MTRLLGVMGLTLLLGVAGIGQASTLQGERVDIEAANTFFATGDYYLRNYGTYALGSVLGLAGLGSVPYIGVLGGGAGVLAGTAAIFWPNIMGSTATHAQASSTLTSTAPQSTLGSWASWLQPLVGMACAAGLARAARSVWARRKGGQQ